MKRLGFNFWGLAPAHVIMLLTLIVPIFIIIAVSFASRGSYGGFTYEFSVKGYQQILFSEGWTGGLEFNLQYLIIILRTIILAVLTTFICAVCAFPVAYWISVQKGARKGVLIFLVTLPFWVSMIVRVYSWLIILGNDGVIESVAKYLGLTERMDSMLFNTPAMLLGMIYSYMPLMILPIYASIEKLDPALLEASRDLYSSRLGSLLKIMLPLCKPGIVAGSILVFVPCLGTVLEPTLLGGGKVMLMGNLVQMQFGGARNWPFGAAIAVLLMAIVLGFLLLNGLKSARTAMKENA
ncbi:ABC transporter permease [Pseudooceanicola nitratireducens]|uniref:ABC transporter permease n=1 Tax=Pseudooceanicola nitratireducens TaxID=517719 RepID=UPI0031031900